MTSNRSVFEHLPGWICLALVGLVYGATMMRVPGGTGDSMNFQLIGGVAGIPHLTGYPLYSILCVLLCALPGIDSALAAHLLTMCCGVATVCLLHRLLSRGTGRPWLALGWSLGFAFGLPVWRAATEAEVYTLHWVFLLLLLLAAQRWNEQPTPNRLAILWFLAWLSLTHHITAGAAWPALAYLYSTHPRRPALGLHALVRLGLLACVALLPYAYILIRSNLHPPHLAMYAPDLPTLLYYLTGGDFRGRMFVFGPSALLHERLPLMMGELWANFGSMGLTCLLLAGIVCFRFPSRRQLIYGLLWLGAFTGFALEYNIMEVPIYFVPTCLLLLLAAAWCGAGACGGGWRARVLVLSLALWAPVQLVWNWRAADRRMDTYCAVFTQAVIDKAPEGAILLLPNWRMHQYFLYQALYNPAWTDKHLYLLLAGWETYEHIGPYLRGLGPLHPHLAFPEGRPLLFPDQPPEPRPQSSTGRRPIPWTQMLLERFVVERIPLQVKGTKAIREETDWYPEPLMYQIVAERDVP